MHLETLVAPPLSLSSRISVVSGVLPNHSIAEILVALTSTNVTHIELTVGPGGHLSAGDTRLASEVRDRITDAGMTVRGVDASLQAPLGDGWLAGILEVAAELDAPFVRVFAPPYDPHVCVEEQMESTATALREFASSTPPEMVTLLENASNSLAPSPELAAHIVNTASHSRVGVLFDPGSMVAEGHLQPNLAIELLGELLQHVHVKNRTMMPRGDTWISEPRNLRDGLVDWPATLDRLIRRRYCGWLSIDHLASDPSVDRLQADVADLRQLVDAAVARASQNDGLPKLTNHQ